MVLERQISRLAKLLVDSEHITFDEAQEQLRALTLEIVVGPDATSRAAHAAVLTAVLVGSRTFIGGVRLAGTTDQPLNSNLPLMAATLGDAAILVGATTFEKPASRRIVIGRSADPISEWAVAPWWIGWCAGTAAPGQVSSDEGENPLVGIAAAALAVGAAFDAARGMSRDVRSEIDLWPTGRGEQAPGFAEIFLPGAIWLIGLGNLGQALLWALAALPYAEPAKVSLVLQDRDKVSEENWATSVLVQKEIYGELKTKIAEQWALARGFDVRRVDRRLLTGDRLEDEDPRVALSGVDRVEARRRMAHVGFDCIVDAGLGRTASHFDRYRVTVFDCGRPIDEHFKTLDDEAAKLSTPQDDAYRRLESEIGACGAAEIAGASIAVPYVSTLAASVAVTRLIAIVSGCACPSNEVGKVAYIAARKLAPLSKVDARGARHAGHPRSNRGP
ncbi:MAG: hypothetical protein ABSD21_09530 [Rhizomicrobium sp.]